MNKLLKNKKICIAILALFVLVLAGILIGVEMKDDKDKDTTNQIDKEHDIVIYDADENTVEEKAEEGLKESDSEDGPVFNKDNMINFDGSDAMDSNMSSANTSSNHTDSGNTDSGNTDSGNTDSDNTDPDDVGDNSDDFKDNNQKDNDEDDSKDTGSFGRFY